jgi:hypothetical protein
MVMTNVGQKIGYGDEILRGFLQTLHGNVGISVVDKGPHPAEPTALGTHRDSEEHPAPQAHRVLKFLVGIFGSDSVLLAEGSVPRDSEVDLLIRVRGPG